MLIVWFDSQQSGSSQQRNKNCDYCSSDSSQQTNQSGSFLDFQSVRGGSACSADLRDLSPGQWMLQEKMGHREQQLHRSAAIIVLLFGLANISFTNCTLIYWEDDVEALVAIYKAWAATPDQNINLNGWNASQVFPCPSIGSQYATLPNWRGVQCLRKNCTADGADCDVAIVSLSISNASLAGTLPPEIGNLTDMSNLELTGNPKLTGPLPATIPNMWLNALDLHDNSFYGDIPLTFRILWNLLQLDLSGNKFSGPFPFNQTRTMDYLQILSIGGNQFAGDIVPYAFENKTELEKLDISNNRFTGPLPSLERMVKLIYLDVSGNDFVGMLPNLLGLTALHTARFSGNKFTWKGQLQDTFNLNAKLTTLDLSNNDLSGALPTWNNLTLGSIQQLYLQNNSLTGTLNIAAMNRLGLLRVSSDNSTDKLEVMDLSNNKISNIIYDNFIIQNISTVFKLQGNPICENYDAGNDGQRCFCTQICFVTPAKTSNRKIIIIAAITSLLAVILIVAVVAGYLLNRTRRYKKYLQLEFSKRFDEYDVKPTIFSFTELRVATRDFHDDMKLGQGGYGAVYKGVLPSGNVVAVKQLYIKTAQGLDEFSNEVVLITGMKHRNLVNLKGCCLREHQRLLVYEYVDNYDVDQVLLGSRRQVVSWPVRLKICLGIARGLNYLHDLAHPRVIHRDIKASNVLLNKDMEPKIADFGLALLFPDEQSHIMTIHVAGTKGYLAPEYASLGQLSDKVDVYSFGVLCLEIISGRRNIDESFAPEQVYLSKYAWHLHDLNRLMDLVDPTLQLTDEEMRDVQRVINVCLLCIQNDAERRPSMARIVSILQSDTESEVVVLGEGKCEPLYKPDKRSQAQSMDYTSRNVLLESVYEEDGSSSSSYSTGRPRRGPSDDLSVAVELSHVRAR